MFAEEDSGHGQQLGPVMANFQAKTCLKLVKMSVMYFWRCQGLSGESINFQLNCQQCLDWMGCLGYIGPSAKRVQHQDELIHLSYTLTLSYSLNICGSQPVKMTMNNKTQFVFRYVSRDCSRKTVLSEMVNKTNYNVKLFHYIFKIYSTHHD